MVPRGPKQKVQSARSSENQSRPLIHHRWRGKEGPVGVLELPGTLESSSSGTGEGDFHGESSTTGEKECAADLLCSEQLIPFNWERLTLQAKTATATASDSEDEDEIMIYNHHAQQWQDEIVLFNQHHHYKQPAAATGEEEKADLRIEKPDEHNHQHEEKILLSLDSTKDEEGSGSKFCLENLLDIDIIADDSFSFWPDEAIFYSRPSSPSFSPGSPSERYPHQSHDSVLSQRMNIQAPSRGRKNLNSTLHTAQLEYTTSSAAAGTDAEKHRTAGVDWFDYEWSLGNWTLRDDAAVIPRALQHDEVSLIPDAQPGGRVLDKSWMDLQRVEHQKWKGPNSVNQTYIPSASLDQFHEEQQLLNQFGDPTQSLQENEGDMLLFPNTKRDRTNSIEMLSKPTSALRKKKQKDGEIPEGRLRGTSIFMDPDLQYGLASLRHLLKDFHEDAGYILDVNDKPSPDAAALLDSELEALSIGENLAPEIRRAVVAALAHGDGSQLQGAAVDWELVEQILNLKMYLVSLLEESRSQEQLVLSQLKDTISRYSFLFPASVEKTLLQRWSKMKSFKDLDNAVCQYFRESELFSSSWSSSSSASSSSSGCAGAGSCSRASSSSSALPLVPFSYEQANALTAAESERGGGNLVLPAAVTETSDRLRIKSRRELSGARGNLPRVAAEFMRSWLFDNFDNPNPSKETKMEIATKFNITEKQVTNYFVNLRARKYRPLLRSLQEKAVPDTESGAEDNEESSESSPSGTNNKSV